MYTVNKLLGLLATTFWYLTTDTAHLYWATIHLKTSVKCALSYWLATLQHVPCLHSAFGGNTASLQHWPTTLNRLCTVFLALTQLIQIHNSSMVVFCPAPMAALYHFASTWLQLAPSHVLDIQCWCTTKFHPVFEERAWERGYYQVSFTSLTVHAMAILIVRSWILYLTSNSLFPVLLLS